MKAITGILIFLLVGCQNSQGPSGSGGTTADNRMTLKKKEDQDFLKSLESRGTRTLVTGTVMVQLLQYSFSQRYEGTNEGDIEEQLNQISINCKRNSCVAKMGEE